MEGNLPETALQAERPHRHYADLPRLCLAYVRHYDLLRFSPLLFYVFQATLIALILISQLDLLLRNLEVPIDFTGDTIYNLAIAKAIVRDGWWWHVRSLAAPGGISLVAMPILGNLDCVILKLFSVFTHKAGLLLNLYWITTVLVAGPISAWCMRRLGAHRWVAFVLGILYALSPHIYYRHTAHLMLTHHLIPLVAVFAVLLALGRKESLSGTTLYCLFAGCVFVGFSYIYYSFFSCFILLVGGLVGFLRRREYWVARVAGLAVSIVLVSAALNLAPSIRSWIAEPGGRRMISFKPASDADQYGLKVRQLITPTDRSPIPMLAALAAKVRAANFPLEDENTLSRMGTVASLGFLLLVAITVFWIGPQMGPTVELLKAIGAINMACVLLGTIGGFGSIFNLLVEPDVRAYNRISIFVVFFSLAAVAVVLTKTVDGFPKDGFAIAASAGALIILLLVGVADQNEAYQLNDVRPRDEKKFQVQSDFIRQIEKALPRDAMIYQLPQMPYGDGDASAVRNPRVEAGAPQEPYILSEAVRWSWPAISAEAISFAHRMGQLDGADLVDNLRDRGFLGIYVDRLGYADDGTALTRSISDYVGRPLVQSVDGRFMFFGLSGMSRKDPSERQRYVWGTPVLFSPFRDAAKYLGEGWSCIGCTEGKVSTMYFNIALPPTDVTLKVHLTPALFGGARERLVKIFVNESLIGEWSVRQRDWYSISVPRVVLEKTTRLALRFELPNAVSPKSLGLNVDPRILSVQFEEMVMRQ